MDASIPVGVSARHVHLTQATLDILFGRGHVLREKSPLSQPGQFATQETIELAGPPGPPGRLQHVRVLGPRGMRTRSNFPAATKSCWVWDKANHLSAPIDVAILTPLDSRDL